MLTPTAQAARRFLRRALGLDAPFPDVAAALAHHGYVQLDPINVCGRMHDLILRNRVAGYREHDLQRHLHGPDPAGRAPPPPDQRVGFEHYLPDTGVLVAFPSSAWPALVPSMEARRVRPRGYSGRLSASEEQLARRVLDALADRGPLTSDDVAVSLGEAARAVTAWGSRTRLVKRVLDKLFFHGRVLITARRGFRRVYDLPERVLPAAVLRAPRPSDEEARRLAVLLRLRQRRLAGLSRAELPLVADHVRQVRLPGCPPCAVLTSDAEALAAAEDSGDRSDPAPRLLAPLDPLIYDRRLTAGLWGFPYTWEVYTPETKRLRGYYALPVLAGLELVGHVDPRADRERSRLEVVSRRVRRGVRVQPAVRELAAFLGLAAR